jgi:hypothetical protein
VGCSSDIGNLLSSGSLLKPPGLWGQDFTSPDYAHQVQTTGAAAIVDPTAADIKQNAARWLTELSCPGRSFEQLFDSYEQNVQKASMHTFIPHDPATCPMLRTNRGTFMLTNLLQIQGASLASSLRCRPRSWASKSTPSRPTTHPMS